MYSTVSAAAAVAPVFYYYFCLFPAKIKCLYGGILELKILRDVSGR